MRRTFVLITAVCGLFCALRSADAAPVTYTFVTSHLVGHGDFWFDALLIDGDGAANTTLTIDQFDFGGGSPVGAPVLTGGASGSLATAVVLDDSAFFNDFTQSFTPGPTLSFRIDFATSATGIPQPDGFQFSILDSNGLPIVTTDSSGLNALILGEFAGGSGTFQEFKVPEPLGVVLLGLGVAATMARRKRARTSSV